MWQKPFQSWDLVVDSSPRLYNLILGRFLATWVVSLAYAGLCQGSSLGSGSNLVTSAAGALSLRGTLGSGCFPASPGVSILGTHYDGPTGLVLQVLQAHQWESLL